MNKEEIKDHRKNSFTQWAYSDQRIDLLIISISGGGIYISLETLKYAIDHCFSDLILLKIIGVIFIVAILCNFMSQFCAKKSCMHDLYSWDDKIAKRNSQKEEALSKQWGRVNTILNNISAISMTLGLLMLIIYFSITF